MRRAGDCTPRQDRRGRRTRYQRADCRRIDAYVRARMAAGEDLYTLRADALAEMQPELILTQDLCRVCALPSGQVSDALEYLGCRADVISLDPRSLDDVLESILLVGSRAGVPDRAELLVAGLRSRLAAVSPCGCHRTSSHRGQPTARRTGLGDRRRRHRRPAGSASHRRSRGDRRHSAPCGDGPAARRRRSARLAMTLVSASGGGAVDPEAQLERGLMRHRCLPGDAAAGVPLAGRRDAARRACRGVSVRDPRVAPLSVPWRAGCCGAPA